MSADELFAEDERRGEVDGPRNVVVAGHDLRVYIEFGDLLEDMLGDLSEARRRIWLEMYILADDPAGKRVAEVLKAKARAGLDVRVLYDAIGSQNTSGAFFADLTAAGVKVHAFHSLAEALYRLSLFSILNRRNHRKLLVIDDQVGYFGGMNIVDHAHLAPPAHPPPTDLEVLGQGSLGKRTPGGMPSMGWRDVHLRMIGPQVVELAESFERSWRRAHHEPVPRRPQAYRRGLLSREEQAADESIHFFDSGPGLKYSRAARVFARMLRQARHQIFISMAYFVPVGQVFRALLAARRRGVNIRILVPGNSDVFLVQCATAYLYSKLVKRGFGIYERQQRMLHSKIMVIDGLWTIAGSCNLDPRSLWINLEFLAVIRSRPLAKIMTDICRNELRQSTRITHAQTERLPWRRRIINKLAWYLRWWL